MELSERIERGQKAKALLEDPFLVGILVELRNQIVRDWQATTDPDAQRAEWGKYAGLDALYVRLHALTQDGDLAQKAVDREQANPEGHRQKLGRP